MKLSDLSIKRPVLAVVMSLLLIVLGTMSFLRLTLRELPAIDPPIVSVAVEYPGASASVVAMPSAAAPRARALLLALGVTGHGAIDRRSSMRSNHGAIAAGRQAVGTAF